jgi:hypothetical protein
VRCISSFSASDSSKLSLSGVAGERQHLRALKTFQNKSSPAQLKYLEAASLSDIFSSAANDGRGRIFVEHVRKIYRAS